MKILLILISVSLHISTATFTVEDTSWSTPPNGYYRNKDNSLFLKCPPGSYCENGIKYPCKEGYFGNMEMLTSFCTFYIS